MPFNAEDLELLLPVLSFFEIQFAGTEGRKPEPALGEGDGLAPFLEKGLFFTFGKLIKSCV